MLDAILFVFDNSDIPWYSLVILSPFWFLSIESLHIRMLCWLFAYW
jgi:hypothetical protein